VSRVNPTTVTTPTGNKQGAGLSEDRPASDTTDPTVNNHKSQMGATS